MFKRSLVALASVLLVACGASKPRPRPPLAGAATPPAAAGLRAAGRPYRINSALSELRLLVYRAGPMARLGHNHVIVNRTVSGWIHVAQPLTSSSFSLAVPSANFSVDETQLRFEEGEDFAEPVPDEARVGTLRNMLSDALLDGVRFPSTTIDSIALESAASAPAAFAGGSTTLTATVAVTVAGHVSMLTLPFVLENSGGQLSATGTAMLRQSELGLKPFSVMLGALQVRDDLVVKFKVVAEAL